MSRTILTGEGFIGNAIKKKLVSNLPLDYTHIPHSEIQTTKLAPFDYFFFCSSYGNLASHEDEAEIFKANIEDLLYIIMQAREMKFKSFVYISTSSVKLRRQTTYSRCKKAAEEILLAVMERYNLPICIVRPFSVTGVGEQPEHLIPTIVRSILTGEKMDFVAEPVHDYINVNDVAEGIISLAQHSARGIFELGTGVSTSNQQVLNLIEKRLGKKANINKVQSMRDYDNEEWVSTNFKSRIYGWLPKKSLEQTIDEIYLNESGVGV